MFWGADGIPISTQRFIEEMFGRLPDFFSSSEDLHTIWSDPDTRDALLEKLEDAGYGEDVLKDIRKIIDAEKCDLLDVLEYIAYATTPIERRVRAERINDYYQHLSDAQKQFVEYIVNAYIKSGVDELRMNKLQTLLSLKFGSVPEGISALGGAPVARKVFKDFQYYLYKIQNA
jgi:type I restriction enzyme R subunit